MPSLFISYRRSDSPDTVKLIHERLKKRLPRWEIFYDHDSIPLGEQFPERLREKVAAASVVLVIIGPKWLDILRERQSAPIDHVREEVRQALDAGTAVVPILVGRAGMPTDGDLADVADLKPLLQLNGRMVRPDPDFDGDLEPIIAHLKQFDGHEAVGATLADKYTLTAEIAHGGMGVVYLAQQKQPVKRTVAVKLIKPGMDSRDVLARFDAERQALAVMDHPNIAKVLDAGIADSGRPFFVMEYVKGVAITQYCDDRKLTPQERLNLFIPVCNAVQHAHQKGIIHRDLKPSNVLVEVVDGKPVPKVIDFGLAKALGQQLTEKTLCTTVGTRVGTLEYSAPEQAAGLMFEVVDTRCDIYSLGVMLYELLTGAPPFTHEELLKIGEDEMRRAIRENEPVKPSKRLSSSGELPAIAANRHLEPKKLTRLVQGDLDWIVMKCLEKERDRRYGAANQLGEELQRFLADEPVQAGPPSARYRMKKFLRRNKGPVIAAALVVLALAAGIVGTSIGLVQAQWAREAEAEQSKLTSAALAKSEENRMLAEKRFNEKRSAVDKMLASFSDERLKMMPGAQEVRQVFLEKGVTQYEQIFQDRNDDPLIRIQLAGRYQEIGMLQSELGAGDEAVATLQKSVDYHRQLANTEPGDSSRAANLGNALFQLGECFWQNKKSKEAGAPLHECIAIFAKLVEDFPEEARFKAALGRTLSRLVNVEPSKDDVQREQRALALLAEAAKMHADDLEILTDFARVNLSLGLALWNNKQNTMADEAYEEARRLAAKVLERDPASATANRTRTFAMNNRAISLRDAGRLDEAARILQEAVQDAKTFARKNPAVVQAHATQLFVQKNLAGVLQRLSKFDDAVAVWEEIVWTCEGLSQRFPQNPQYAVDSVGASQNMVETYRTSKRESKAAEILDKVIKQAESHMALHPTSDGLLNGLLRAHQIRGVLSSELEEYDRASGAYQAGVDLFTRYRSSIKSPSEGTHYNYLLNCSGLVTIAKEKKGVAQAVWLAEKLIVPIKLETFTTVDYQQTLVGQLITLATLYEDTGRVKESLSIRLSAVEQSRKILGGDPKSNWYVYQYVFGAYLHLPRLYRKIGEPRLEFEALRTYLKETEPYVSARDHSKLLGETAEFTPLNLGRLRDVYAKFSSQRTMMRFTVPNVDFSGLKYPFDVYVTESWPYLEDQFTYVEKVRGGKMPIEVVNSFSRLYKVAKENKVSFPDLCVYTLSRNSTRPRGQADDNANPIVQSRRLQKSDTVVLEELAEAKQEIQAGNGGPSARKRLALKYAQLAEDEIAVSDYFRAAYLLKEAREYVELDSFERLRDPKDREVHAYLQYVQGAQLGGSGEPAKGYAKIMDSMQVEPETVAPEFAVPVGNRELALGWICLKLKRPSEAAMWYRKAMDLGHAFAANRLYLVYEDHPQSTQVLPDDLRRLLVGANAARTRDESAAQAFARLLAKDRGTASSSADYAERYRFLAGEYLKQSKPAEALQAYLVEANLRDLIYRFDSTLQTPKDDLGRALPGMKLLGSIPTPTVVQKAKDNHIRALVDAGKVSLELGKNFEGIKLLEKAHLLGDEKTTLLLADLYEQGKVVAKDSKKAASLRSNLSFQKGTALYNQLKYADALVEFERAVKYEPSVGGYQRIGWSQRKIKRHEDAVASFKKSIELGTTLNSCHWVILDLAEAALSANKPEEVFALLRLVEEKKWDLDKADIPHTLERELTGMHAMALHMAGKDASEAAKKLDEIVARPNLSSLRVRNIELDAWLKGSSPTATQKAAVKAILAQLAAPARDVASPYHPLKQRQAWVYKSSAGDEITVRATRPVKFDERGYWLLETLVNGKVTQSEQLCVELDGLYRQSAFTPLLQPHLRILPLPARDGEKWAIQSRAGKLAVVSGEGTTRIEDVVVPMGQFKGTIVAELKTQESNGEKVQTIWYAKDVGPVKIVTKSNAGLLTLELQKVVILDTWNGPIVLQTVGKLVKTDPLDKVLTKSLHQVHTLKMSAGDTYTIELESGEFDAYLRLEDAAGNRLVEDDDGGGDRNARISRKAFKDETVRIIATSYAPGATGTYLLTVRQQKEHKITLDKLGKLIKLSHAELLAADADSYVIVLDRGRLIEDGRPYWLYLKVKPSKFREFMRLSTEGRPHVFKEFGTVLRFGFEEEVPVSVKEEMKMKYGCEDDYMEQLNKRVKAALTELEDQTIGAMIDLIKNKQKLELVNDNPAAAGKIVLQAPGKLAKTDPLDKAPPNAYHQVHTFKMAGGVTYTIDLESSDFDACLRLEDAAGKLLASDHGDKRNARIVHKISKDDTVRIIATSNKAGTTGSYSLTIRQLPGAYRFDSSGKLMAPTEAELMVADATTYLLVLDQGLLQDGTPYWAYVAVKPSKYKEYIRRTKAHEIIRHKDYGTVLRCGLDKEVPASVKEEMKKDFQFDEKFAEKLNRELTDARTAFDKKLEDQRINEVIELLKKKQRDELFDEKAALTGFSGLLTREDPLDTFSTTKSCFCKTHTIPFVAGKIYQVDVTGDFDTLLRIEDAQQKPLLLNDDINTLVPNVNSRLIFSPAKDDAYRVIVTSFEKGTTGKYTLKIQEVAKVGKEEIVKSELTEKDEKNKQGKFIRYHKFQLEAGRPYILEAESDRFDTYLALFDPTGKKFAAASVALAVENRRAVRIDFTPAETATYVIMTTSSRPGETGAYTLRLQGYGPATAKK